MVGSYSQQRIVLCSARRPERVGTRMNAVDQEFLLSLAGVSATLLGTFIVGVFFYIESSMHRRMTGSRAMEMYLRSGTRWVFTAYSIPLFVPLVLAVMDPLWGAITFAALGMVLTVLTVETGRRTLAGGRSGMSHAFVTNEWATSAAVLAAMILPWALGGWIPRPAEFVPSLLLLLASGFASTAALVMAQFDATRVSEATPRGPATAIVAGCAVNRRGDSGAAMPRQRKASP
ncbi:hypothetical protein [Occultella gossypii]|uniref:Uncharacterized protein n=1 Tax=Occultella gossypii TaxID=2800820 RepID=A0ABS7S996_9MICO|nr:hypothetical protein [Occultella gossypii]MBZ2196919.1 hypothetical protein [Occultella gossypii]